MIVRVVEMGDGESLYHGLCMSADEYLNLKDDGCRYELIHGVVTRSPSPTAIHQRIVMTLSLLLGPHVSQNKLGEILCDIDVPIMLGPGDEETVYRPDLIFVRVDRAAANRRRITEPPALVVEVVSPSTRSLDCITKKQDYERAGIEEYWIIDPDKNDLKFYGLSEGTYRELPVDGDRFTSHVVEGFSLDLARIRRAYQE